MSTKNFMTMCATLSLLHKGRTCILALGLVLVIVVTAQAADLCINLPIAFSAPLVGKGFILPLKNKCKPFNGFIQTSPPFFAAGTGCRSADGFTFYLSFTAHAAQTGPSFANTVTGACGFNVPTLNGGCVMTATFADQPGDEVLSTSGTATGQTCTVNLP